jgi:hypothetical protein
VSCDHVDAADCNGQNDAVLVELQRKGTARQFIEEDAEEDSEEEEEDAQGRAQAVENEEENDDDDDDDDNFLS